MFAVAVRDKIKPEAACLQEKTARHLDKISYASSCYGLVFKSMPVAANDFRIGLH